MRLSLLCILITCSLSLFSQTNSQFGRFSVSAISGCAPFEIEITEQDDFGDITRQYIYEDGLAETDARIHTFQVPGIYNIVQIVGVDVDPKTDTLQIEVFENRPVSFDLIRCEGNELQIVIQDEYYDQYLVAFENGDQILDTGPVFTYQFSASGIQTISIQGLFEDGSQNCQVSSQDINVASLSNEATIESIELNKSCLDLVSPTLLLSLDPQVRYQLRYGIPGFTEFEVLELNESIITISEIEIPQGAVEVCFSVDAVSVCNGTIIEGSLVCSQIGTDSLESSLSGAYSSFEDGGIGIYFEDLGIQGYQLTRQVDGFPIDSLGPVFSGFVDDNISSIRSYQYGISFEDTCGNQLDERIVAPPFLDVLDQGPNEYSISWLDPINDFDDGLTSVELSILGSSGETRLIENFAKDTDILLSEEQGSAQQIQLRLYYSQLDSPIISNTLALRYSFQAYIPDAFTPNGDGLNDRLRAFGLVTDEIQFKIFNRWGELVVISSDPNILWDGTINAENAPVGKYFYSLEYLNIEGQLIQQQGSFVLIRN